MIAGNTSLHSGNQAGPRESFTQLSLRDWYRSRRAFTALPARSLICLSWLESLPDFLVLDLSRPALFLPFAELLPV